jgi:hypothetical protein
VTVLYLSRVGTRGIRLEPALLGWVVVDPNVELMSRCDLNAVELLPNRRRASAMKVEVDFALCESNALCMQALPEVFLVRADDFLYLMTNEIKSA